MSRLSATTMSAARHRSSRGRSTSSLEAFLVKRKTRSSRLRFAAKLLFQFRVAVKGRSNQRRLCEERIVIIGASSAEIAHRIALRKGKKSEHHYENNAGGMV